MQFLLSSLEDDQYNHAKKIALIPVELIGKKYGQLSPLWPQCQ
jgi:hypothetical protein